MTAPDPNYHWLAELPMPPGDPFLRMGTRSTDEAGWLLLDHVTNAELELRARLVTEHPEHAQLLPGHEDELRELIDVVETCRQCPLQTGPALDGVRTELADLAVSIQEDVLLMVRNSEHWYLAGGVLMFPDQWTLPDKIGRSMAQIHEPTDGYSELLQKRADQFLDKLAPGRLVRRRNWFVHDEPVHFLANHIDQRAFTNPAEVANLWLRSERQTLRCLHRTGAIVFTVKTQFAPFPQVKARPVVAGDLVEFLSLASEQSLRNKDAFGRSQAVIDYLTQ